MPWPRIPSAWRTMKRPMPKPPVCTASSRVNASNILGICSLGIPIPVSYTSIRTSEPAKPAANKDAAARLGVFDRVTH
jgi:hypothetical protein